MSPVDEDRNAWSHALSQREFAYVLSAAFRATTSCLFAAQALVVLSSCCTWLSCSVSCRQTNGTTLDGKKMTPQKPVQLHDGAALHFGKLPTKYVVRCEETGAPKEAAVVAPP